MWDRASRATDELVELRDVKDEVHEEHHMKYVEMGGIDPGCYDPPQFFSSIPVAPATAPPAVHAPAPALAVQLIPAQPVAPPQPYC